MLTSQSNWVALTVLFVTIACSQPKQEDYPIGFNVLRTTDTSRLYKTNSKTTDYLHYRPLDIDVWYPAQAVSVDSLLTFGDFLRLLEKRANYYTASTVSTGYATQLADYLCKGMKCSDTTRLLNYKTNSYRNAQPAQGKFPLIVYLASYNGMGHENYALVEEWVKKGFVVVSINSIGRYPGDMTMKKEDLLEQVNDALYSINYLKSNPSIDFSKIGVTGYSWGGLAGSLVANKIRQAACLVSLDGSEFHHYGVPEEDADFEDIVNSPSFERMSISIPYLRLEQSPIAAKSGKDSVYNFLMKTSGEKQVIKIDSASHEDFSCMPTTVKKSGGCPNNDRFGKIATLSLNFFQKHLN